MAVLKRGKSGDFTIKCADSGFLDRDSDFPGSFPSPARLVASLRAWESCLLMNLMDKKQRSRSRDAPSSRLWPLSCVLSSHHLQKHLWDQPTHGFYFCFCFCFSYLNSLLLNTMSSQIHQKYSTEVEFVVNPLPNLHLRASHTHLSRLLF